MEPWEREIAGYETGDEKMSDTSVICPDCRGERRIKGELCPRCGGGAQISRHLLRADETPPFEPEPATAKRMEVDTRMPGYAHVTLQGTCGPDVTAEDVRNRFYHSYFGGRDEWVKDGRFGVTRHTD